MYFLDSCICIDFLRGDLRLGYELMRQSDPRLFKVPAVVEAELLLGAEKSANSVKNRLLVEQFLLPFEVVPFCSRCAREYAVIRAHLERKGQPIGPNDLIIAATARAHNGVLVSRNVDEFKRVPGLRLEMWAEVDL